MFGFLKESAYRFTGRFSARRPISARFRPVCTRHHRFLCRPTHRHAPRLIPGRIRQLFTPPLRFFSAAYPPLCPARFIGSAADYRSIPVGFCPVAADFSPPRSASAPLSTGANGERRIHSVAKLERLNTIYMSSGPSKPIFTFLIQFEFYLTKQSRFEKKFSTNVIRISSSFLHNFFRFFLFFSKFLNFNSKNWRFLKSDPANPAEFWRFSEKSAGF
jgi:hypothetical protein